MKNKFFLLAITFCLPIHSQGVSKSFIPMAEIPAGSFYMGSDGLGEDFDEAPIHQVIISRPFRMGITEITNAQYESFRPEHRALRGKNGVSLEDDEAVVNVSYSDAVAFCEWLSGKKAKTIVCQQKRNGNMLVGQAHTHYFLQETGYLQFIIGIKKWFVTLIRYL